MRATEAQIVYLKRLTNEAFARGYSIGYATPEHVLRRMSVEEASQLIAKLVAAKNRGWTAEARPVETEQFAHFELPDGSRGTVLARLWYKHEAKFLAQGRRLVHVGLIDRTWHRGPRR